MPPTVRSAISASALLLSASLLGCSAARVTPAAPAPAAAPVKDSSLGLSRTSVFEVPAPPLFHAEDSAPGEKPLPPRLSTGAPPVIPHGVEAFDPIRRDANACVDCHLVVGPKKAGEATPIPASHFYDLRRAPTVKGEKIAGTRWVCTACHVARSDAAPLVGSGDRP